VLAEKSITQNLRPEFAAALAAMPDLAISADTLVESRALLLGLLPEMSFVGVEQADQQVNADVVVRVHRPASERSGRPCVYSIHGGGYVLGSYVMDDLLLGAWCSALDCVGVSVEYRLAPEHPYPT